MYATPHRHDTFPDHLPRIVCTVEVGQQLRTLADMDDRPILMADLSCGDAAILTALTVPGDDVIRGDLAPGYSLTGHITVNLTRIGIVDLYVCCETLEHLNMPADTLADIRDHTDLLLLSTPVDAWQDDNPEHIWAWSKTDVEDMLTEASFSVAVYQELDMRPQGYPYCWGIWGCR